MQIRVKYKYSGMLTKLNSVRRWISSSKQKAIMGDLASLARDILYSRVKSGYGVNSDTVANPSKVRLTKLSSGYRKYRRKHPPTGKFATAGKSNATYTGQMLDAIKYDIYKEGFRLYINNNARKGDDQTNKQVAQEYSLKRPFFSLIDREKRQVQRAYFNILRQLSRKYLRK
jgi:hypothetical protein